MLSSRRATSWAVAEGTTKNVTTRMAPMLSNAVTATAATSTNSPRSTSRTLIPVASANSGSKLVSTSGRQNRTTTARTTTAAAPVISRDRGTWVPPRSRVRSGAKVSSP